MYWDLEDEDSVSEIAALKQQLEAEKSEKLEWMSNSAKASAELEAERAKTVYAKTLLRKALDTGIGQALEIAAAFANDRPYPEDILAALQAPEVKP